MTEADDNKKPDELAGDTPPVAAALAVSDAPEPPVATSPWPPSDFPSSGTSADAAADEPTLEQLLEQYDQSVASRQQPAYEQQQLDPAYAQPQQQPQQPDPGAVGGWLHALRADDLAGREQALQQAVHQQKQQEFIKAETDAFIKFSSEGQAEIADLNLPQYYVEDALIAAAMKNPQLRQLWDARNNPGLSEQARRVISAQLRAVRDDVVQQAKRRPDPIATGDRDLVAAAVRGASGGAHVPDPPPRYGVMGENEFRRTVRDSFGFDPMTGM
jgi:hypothetical protein